jgi:hypothetical protein
MTVHQIPTAAKAPPAAVMRILERFERQELEGFIAIAIDLLDTLSGDTDVELNGDEQDSDGDENGDPAYIEWHSRHGRKTDRFGAERLARDHYGNTLREDDEDDDPAGQCDEDGINTALEIRRGSGAGCTISDSDYEESAL